MDIMEEGNMADRIRILLQRDSVYYNEHHTVLQEDLCPNVVAGTMNYPRVASFVSTKLIRWWDAEYDSAVTYHQRCLRSKDKSGIPDLEDSDVMGKKITLVEFVSMISQSVPKVIDHFHMLTQEALDHADLSVLIATIGAANLLKNKISAYDKSLRKYRSEKSLKTELKMFNRMAEALAERLLDLHCRLICLYILQDLDSLNWASNHLFFEGEMSSFVIRMWWLYMQGIKDDLWNTVPAVTAIQVLKGTLNETLTVLTSRYSKAYATYARNTLIVGDISNLLLCVYKLLPFLCDNIDDIFGTKISVFDVADLHVKCHYLFCQLLLRGAPMSILYKVFKDGAPACFRNDRFDILADNPIQPWTMFAALQDKENISPHIRFISSLSKTFRIKIHLQMLLSQPQLNWILLIKVLFTHSCYVTYEILHDTMLMGRTVACTEQAAECKGFLCNKQCSLNTCQIEEALIRTLIILNDRSSFENTVIKVLEESTSNDWSVNFNENQISNQNISGWIRGMLSFTNEVIEQVTRSVSDYLANETSEPKEILQKCIRNTITVIDCLAHGLFTLSLMIEEVLPANVHPFADSVIAQLIAMSLFNQLKSKNHQQAADLLCHLSASSDNMVKDLQQAVNSICTNVPYVPISDVSIPKLTVEKILNDKNGRSLCAVLYNYLQNNSEWLQLKVGCRPKSPDQATLLYKISHICDNPYDQVLTGMWTPNWSLFLKMSLALTREKTWNILSTRPEFWCNSKPLSEHDKAVVNHMKTFLQPINHPVSS